MLKIHTILCRAGTMDNYAYLLVDEATGKSAIIDPSEVAPIVAKCQELNIKPDYIFNTHHHFDHTDGNLELKALYGAKVVGNEADKQRIPGFDIGVIAGGTFALGESVAEIIDVSAHTQGHILWYFPQSKVVFTGDTLFNLCVGGLFEGDATQMFGALQKIKDLPDDTSFYPGHEYTIGGARFAYQFNHGKQSIQDYLQIARERLDRGLPVHPTLLGLEKQCNPYLEASTATDLDKLC